MSRRRKLDVAIEGSWGLYSCTPLTRAAQTFVKAKVDIGDWQDPERFHIEGGDRCRALVAGMVAEGLRVEVNGQDMKGFKYGA